ncbi:hypothetical protein AB0B25_24200 [Nocardia sp. NPDC049190]|uniref:hypothetical protein n=1 Tax=Nocardia sp. NPDC049190 TaxID=3155650 RepID=UPI0033FE21BA
MHQMVNRLAGVMQHWLSAGNDEKRFGFFPQQVRAGDSELIRQHLLGSIGWAEVIA